MIVFNSIILFILIWWLPGAVVAVLANRMMELATTAGSPGLYMPLTNGELIACIWFGLAGWVMCGIGFIVCIVSIGMWMSETRNGWLSRPVNFRRWWS